ncbi:MAG: hypothetical protein DRP93_08510 [Candidatus Neomarinimicrobiota bacterium]|nr:MAG: hypothetical protein DRP93_08510 [Candidatus Neomarinimicrobiota bacterium]
MILFKRRGRPRFGNGFRPAIRRRGGILKQHVAEPKIGLDLLTKTELKTYIAEHGGSFGITDSKAKLLTKALAL